MTDVAPQPPPGAIPTSPLDATAHKLSTALQAAPELRSRPNLAVAAAQSQDPATYAQVLAHASNLAALHKAAHTLAATKGGQVVLQRQLAKASGRYAKATGQSLWARLGDDAVGIGDTLAHGATAALNAIPGLHLGDRTNQLGGEVVGAAKATGRDLVNINPLGNTAASLQAAGSQPMRVAEPKPTDLNPLHAVPSVLNLLNAPLNEVLHQYRYLHDVEARHGMAAAALAGMGLLAGAVVGGISAGPEGIPMGAAAAEGIEARVLWHDSWERTQSGNTYRDPHTGLPVSPGRDLAGAVGLQPGTGAYNDLSGVTDAISDLAMDPVSYAGGLVGKARSLEGAGGLLGKAFSGTRVSADTIDRVYSQYPSFRRALENMVGKTPAEIAIADPRLTPIAKEIASAHSGEDILGVFKGALRTQTLTDGFRAPTMTLTRQGYQGAVDRIKQWAAAPIDPGTDPTGVLEATKQTGVVQRAIDAIARSQTRLPEDWDPELMRYDSHSLDLMGDTAPKALYQFLRQGESDFTAKATVNQFLATSDPGQRLQIWHKAISDLLLSRAAKVALHGTFKDAEGIFADPQVLQKLQNAAAELSPEGQAGGVYGADQLGNDISTVRDAEGNTYGAGILQNHVGRVTVPTFTEVKRSAQAVAGVHSYLGRADDFLYDAVTQRLFKRAVLLSGSFAEHIVAGEMIQSGLRVGTLNMMKSIVADVAARLGYDLAKNPDEAEQIAAGAAWAADLPEAAAPEDKINHFTTAAALRMRHGVKGQQFAAAGIAAGHHFADEVKSVDGWRDILGRLRAKAPSKHFVDTFGLFGHDPQDEGQRWASWLNELSADPATREAATTYLDRLGAGASDVEARTAAAQAAANWLDQQPESYLRNFVRHTAMSEQGWELGLTPHQDWGRVIVDNMLGATTSVRGQLDDNLLRRISVGARTDPAELADRALVDSPMAVKGRKVEHYVSGTLERIATFGHRRILSPFINTFSRDPTYIAEVTSQMKALEPLIRDGMGFDEAMNVAETRASQNMIRFVHNIGERTQFSEMMRNVAPFFFAQQQAYKRLFRLGVENPGALRRYQMGLQALAQFGIHHTNAQGIQSVVYPGVGSMTGGMLQGFSALGMAPSAPIPIQWQGALSSADVIAPFSAGTGSYRPDLGPLVQIPMAGLQILFSELQAHGVAPKQMAAAQNAIATIEGPIPASQATPSKFWSYLVPNTFVQRVMEAVDPSLLGTYYSSSMHQMLAVLDYEQTRAMHKWIADGRKGPKPAIMPSASAEKTGDLTPQQQQFVDRVVNGTRVLAMTKALLGLVSPLSPQLSFDEWGLTQDVQNDIKKYGLGQGIDHFLAEHPDASAFTVFSSSSEAGGAQIPATGKAMQWVDQHNGFINRNPDAALYFMPNSAGQDTYSQQAYNQQLAMHLRVKRTNQQFLQALYKANGDFVYYNVIRAYYDAGKAMAANPGMSESEAFRWAQDPRNAATLEATRAPAALSTWMNQSIAALEAQNPTWGEEFEAGSSNARIVAQQALTGIRSALTDPQVPHNQQTELIGALVKAYDGMAAALPVGDSSYATYQQIEAQKQWREWLDTVTAEYPEAGSVIRSVFYDLGSQVG